MSDEIPESLVPLLTKMGIQIHLLRDVVLFLCATTVPRETMEAYIERISVPVDWGSRENFETMEREISALLRDLNRRFEISQP